jgi:FtsH-binding integral membrane protein
MSSAYKLLQLALVVFGAVALLVYPLALVWPSGWAWHSGAPYESDYFMMIVGIYATLGVFLINAARNPAANLSLIWFAVWSSVVHAAIMAVQSFSDDHMGHLWGDVLALLLVAIVLSALVVSSGLKWSASEAGTSAGRSPR